MTRPSAPAGAPPDGQDEERRYRAVAALDPAARGDLARLVAALADPSWRVRSAVVDRLGAMADPRLALATLLETFVAGATIGARDGAASALVRIGAPAVPPLVERLGAVDAELRQAAASVLGGIADRRAVAPLTARLADPDANVRGAVAEALGKIGGSDATAALRAALDSAEPTLRLAALEALVALRACPAGYPITSLLDDRLLRRPAFRLLGSCDDAASLELLAGGIADPSRTTREAALAALGQQRSRRPLSELEPLARALCAAAVARTAVADGCAASLACEEPSVAIGALTSLAWIGAPRHVPAALRLADDERFRTLVEEALEALAPDAGLRQALADALPELGSLARVTALAALARLGSPAALESLVREASDREAFVQVEAIAALGRLGDPRVVAPLAGLLGDDVPSISGVAATALTRIGASAPAARAAALAALRDRAGAGPSAALYRALGALGEAEDLDRLRVGLRSASVVQRMAAAAAIGALALRGCVAGRRVPELVAALSDPAWSVRASAARAFAGLARASSTPPGSGAPRAPVACADAVGALADALRDPEPAVRAAAAEALGCCGRRECASAIAALVSDASSPPLVVVAALHALVELGPPPLEVVERAAHHADPEVVKEAVLAAASLAGEDGPRLLCEAAASPRWDIRRSAARAMAARGDAALAATAARLAAEDPDPLVARAFAEAALALGRPG